MSWAIIRQATEVFMFHDVYMNDCILASEPINTRLQELTRQRRHADNEWSKYSRLSQEGTTVGSRRKATHKSIKYAASRDELDVQLGPLQEQANERNAQVERIRGLRGRALDALNQKLHAFQPPRKHLFSLLGVTDMTSLRMLRGINHGVVHFRLGSTIKASALQDMHAICRDLGIEEIFPGHLYELNGNVFRSISEADAWSLGWARVLMP